MLLTCFSDATTALLPLFPVLYSTAAYPIPRLLDIERHAKVQFAFEHIVIDNCGTTFGVDVLHFIIWLEMQAHRVPLQSFVGLLKSPKR